MVRSRSIGFISRILGFALISDISNISRVLIPNIVGDNLGTTIRKIYTVFTRGSITITVLTLSKVGTRVVISDSITILVKSWAFISGLMVSLLRVSGLVGGSRLVDWSRLVDRGRVVRSGLVDWGRIVDGRVGGVGLRMSMVNGVTVDGVGESMVAMNVGMVTMNGSMISMVKVKSTVVARGVDTSNIFFLIVVLVNLIGSGSGL